MRSNLIKQATGAVVATVVLVPAVILFANHRREVLLWTADQLPTPAGFPSRSAFSQSKKNMTVEISYSCPKRRDNGRDTVEVGGIEQAWAIAKEARPKCQSSFQVLEK